MRRTRKILATGLAAASLAISAGVAGASAQSSSTQNVSFQVTGGLLTVTAPAAVTALTPAGGTLGTVSVADLRVPGGTNWSLAVSVTDFTATVPVSGTITADKAKIWIPGKTFVSALTTPATQYDENNKLTLSTSAQTFVTTTSSSTGNTVTFAPSMSVDTSGAPAALYSGTVTYTVS